MSSLQTQPSWTLMDAAVKRQIHYTWDDTDVVSNLDGDSTEVLRAALKMNMRARLVLCMGLYEWIIWRFDGLHNDSEPLQLAKAGWCAVVDPNYMRYYEWVRTDWLGPIRGPLWCAMTWLHDALSNAINFPGNVYNGLSNLGVLAQHISPDKTDFFKWLQPTLERLVATCPEIPDDPFSNLLDDNFHERFGPLIGQEALDPAQSLSTRSAREFLRNILHDAQSEGNLFLATPEDLAETDFNGTPYELPH